MSFTPKPLPLDELKALRDSEAARGHQFNVDVLEDIIAQRRIEEENKAPVPHPKGIE